MREPGFWRGGLDPRSRASAPVTRALLSPLAMVYAWAGARRIATTQGVEAGVPVICVGNLTLGGTGKTPLVEAVRGRLVAQGVRAASLSRGWKGRLAGPLRVGAEHDARAVGDEPCLLARTGEAWIARDRVAGALAMAQAGVQAVVMDDGHQNPSLIKALSLVVIDAGAPFGNGHVFPKGKLREPVAAGLARADGVILMGEGEVSGLPGLRDRVPVLRAWLEGVGAVPEGPLVAFAGIGRPQKVFDALEADGAELVEAVAFDDHHAFTPGDLAYVSRLAQERGARLITTAKDVVRLPPEFRARVLVREVRVAWGEGDAGRLDALLAGVVPGSA